MTIPPETFSESREVTWHDRGSSQLVVRDVGSIELPTGVLEMGDAAAVEDMFPERSIQVPLPAAALEIDIAVVEWDDGRTAGRLASITGWAERTPAPIRWVRNPSDLPVLSAVGTWMDASTRPELLVSLNDDAAWPPVMSAISRDAVYRLGQAILFDCGTAAGDFPSWLGKASDDSVVAVRLSTMLLDESTLGPPPSATQ